MGDLLGRFPGIFEVHHRQAVDQAVGHLAGGQEIGQ